MKAQKINYSLEFRTSFKDKIQGLSKIRDQLNSIKIGGDQGAQFKNLSKEFNNFFKEYQSLENLKLNTNNVEEYDKKIEKLTRSYSHLVELSAQFQNAPNERRNSLTTKLNSQENKLLKLAGLDPNKMDETTRLKELNRLLGTTAGQLGLVGDAAKKFSGTKGSITTITNSLKALGASEAEIQDLINGILQLNSVTEAMGTERGNIRDQFNAQNIEQMNQSVNSLITRFTSFGAVTMLARRAISSLVSTFKELDEGLVAIAAVSGKTRDVMWGSVGQFNEMAQRLGATTKQIVEASKLYYQQGRSQSETMRLVEQTTILATVSELDFVDATNYLTAAVNGFNIAASDSSVITDTWSALAAAAAVDVEELAISLSKVASLADNAGMSIQTTSAFLTKMVETTREAPENLGTALKTIISRFNDLKISEEELSDGTSANKVEKALASAGVALRDSAGNFRDFDTVLLELSQVWDSLSINTQKYIATQAAGSRQQSRFIALVSDYERNLELLDIAQDSYGSSLAQFNVHLTGLQASFNRLTSAWEGFYTSLSQGPNLISGIVDLLAKVVSLFSEFGVVGTTVIGIVAAMTVKVLLLAAAKEAEAVATAQAAAATEADTNAKRRNSKEIIKNSAAVTGQNLAEAAASMKLVKVIKSLASAKGLVFGKYALIIGAAAGLITVIVRLATAHEREIKALKEKISLNEQASAQSLQNARNAKNLLDEYEKAYRTGEDLSSIKQKIIDQFGEEIENIEKVTNDYDQLTESLKNYIREEQRKAALDTAAGFQNKKKLHEKEFPDLEKKRSKEILKQKEKKSSVTFTSLESDDTYYWKDGASIPENVISWGEAEIQEAVNNGLLIPESVIDDELEELVEHVQRGVELSQQEIGVLFSDWSIDNPDQGIDQSVFGAILNSNAIDFNENGTLSAEEEQKLQAAADALQQEKNKIFAKSADQGKAFENFLLGDYSNLSLEEIENFSKKYEKALSDVFGDKFEEITKPILDSKKKEFQQSSKFFDDNFQKLSNLNNISLKVKKSVSGAIEQVGGLESAFGKQLKDVFSSLLRDESLGKEFYDALGKVDFSDDSSIFTFLTKLKPLIKDNENAFLAISKAMNLAHVDLGKISSDIQRDMLSSWDKLKSAIYEGVDFSEIPLLSEELGLEKEAFVLDTFTGKYKIAKEVAVERAKALREESKAEAEANIQTALRIAGLEEISDFSEQEVKSRIALLEAEITEGWAALGISSEEEKANLKAAKSTAILNIEVHKNNILTAENNILKGSSEGTEYWAQKIEAERRAIEEENKELSSLSSKYATLFEKENVLSSLQDYVAAGFNKSGYAEDYMSEKTKGANKAIDAQTKALEEQQKALEKSREALEKEKEALEDARDALKDYLDLLLEAIKNRLNKEVEDATNAVNNYYEAMNQALDKLTEGAQEALDKLQEHADKTQKIADDDAEELNKQAEGVQKFYDAEIAAIQEKIDAIRAEKESLDDLMALEKARDAYAKAKQKTRLVLVAGAGWRFKTDKEALSEAGDNLVKAEQDAHIKGLEDQIASLEDIKKEWEDIAKNIGKATSELEKEQQFQEFLKAQSPEDLENLKNKFGEDVLKNNKFFQDALEAQNEFDIQNDKDNKGSLAWQMAQWEEMRKKAEQDKHQFEILTDSNAKIIEELKNQMINSLGSADEKNIGQALQVGLDLAVESGLKVDKVNQTLAALEELSKKMDMTSEQIAQYDAIQNQIGQASLDQLLSGGSIYNQLSSQIGQLVGMNDQIADIDSRIKTINDQLDEIKVAIDNAKTAAEAVRKAAEAAKTSSTPPKGVYVGGVFIEDRGVGARDPMKEGLAAQQKENRRPKPSQINLKDKYYHQYYGAEVGGVVDYTGPLAVHGGKNRPELVLNNSQAAGLFNFLDNLAFTPFRTSKINAGSTTTTNNTDNSTLFTNCTFEITSQENSFDGLVKDMKRKASFRKR